jgi:hypothetical protein
MLAGAQEATREADMVEVRGTDIPYLQPPDRFLSLSSCCSAIFPYTSNGSEYWDEALRTLGCESERWPISTHFLSALAVDHRRSDARAPSVRALSVVYTLRESPVLFMSCRSTQ